MGKRAKTKQQNAAVSSQRKKPKREEPNSDDATFSLLPSERKNAKRSETNSDVFFVGKPIPATDARQRWPHRYPSKAENKALAGSSNSEINDVKAKCHYTQANVDGVIYSLNDDAYVKAGDGDPDYIARIIELFEGVDNEQYFTARWFYRAEDTVIKSHGGLVDKKRVFISDVRDVSPLDCIVSKVRILQIAPNVDLATKKKMIPSCDLYYDMKYTVPYLTFSNIDNETTSDVRNVEDRRCFCSCLDLNYCYCKRYCFLFLTLDVILVSLDSKFM